MTRITAVLAVILLVAACGRADSEDPALTNGVQSQGLGGGVAIGSFAPGSQEALAAEAGDTIYFEFDSSVIRPESQAVLRQQAAWLAQNSGATVVIEGHTDERGTREYNLALGERRAEAVRAFLVGLGVSGNRLRTVSFGEERPVAAGSNEQAWAENRRAQTRVDVTS